MSGLIFAVVIVLLFAFVPLQKGTITSSDSLATGEPLVSIAPGRAVHRPQSVTPVPGEPTLATPMPAKLLALVPSARHALDAYMASAVAPNTTVAAKTVATPTVTLAAVVVTRAAIATVTARSAISVAGVSRMQKEIADQKTLIAEQRALIAALTGRALGDPEGSDESPQPLRVPVAGLPPPPLAIRDHKPASAGDGTARTIAHVARAPVLDVSPWSGWSVFGMNPNSVMLENTAGSIRIVHRGDTFEGIQLLTVDPKTNVAYTSAGRVHRRTH